MQFVFILLMILIDLVHLRKDGMIDPSAKCLKLVILNIFNLLKIRIQLQYLFKKLMILF